MNFFLWLILLLVAGTGFAQTTVLNGTSGNATSSSNFSTGTSGNSITLSQGFFAEYLIVGGDGNGRWAGDIGDSSGAGAERRVHDHFKRGSLAGTQTATLRLD